MAFLDLDEALEQLGFGACIEDWSGMRARGEFIDSAPAEARHAQAVAAQCQLRASDAYREARAARDRERWKARSEVEAAKKREKRRTK